MATVVTNFISKAGMESAYSPIYSGWSLGSAVTTVNNTLETFDISYISSLSSSYLSGYCPDGSTFQMQGSGFTSYVWKTTSFTIQSSGFSTSFYGNMITDAVTLAQTGYIDRIVLQSNDQGKITIRGYDNAAQSDSTISSVTWEHGGATLVASGSITVGSGYALSGNYTSATLTFNGHSISLSGISIDANSSYLSFDTFLGAALAGADSISGSAGGDYLVGYGGNDTLNGLAGADTLDGGAGADKLIGGLGNDIYSVDNAGDVVTETSTLVSEIDLVKVGISTVGGSYTLTANVENGTLVNAVTFNLTGNGLNNVLTGNAAANILSGGLGNDTLDGGAGADTLIGGAGNDNYIVGEVDDTIVELDDEGTDFVKVTIVTAGGTYVLSEHIENATLTNSVAFNLTGNDLNNVLIGNAAANALNGGQGNDTLDGGAGVDTLIGGAGDDTYAVDNIGDLVEENADEGTDLVNVAIAAAGGTYVLTEGSYVENLTLINTVAFNLTGNSGANALTGNAAANVLDGGSGDDTLDGGAGNDTLIGGLGNDTYVVSAATDIITEQDGEGIDQVNIAFAAAGTFALGNYLENATLTIDPAGRSLHAAYLTRGS